MEGEVKHCKASTLSAYLWEIEYKRRGAAFVKGEGRSDGVTGRAGRQVLRARRTDAKAECQGAGGRGN